jgi:hypothetical protein
MIGSRLSAAALWLAATAGIAAQGGTANPSGADGRVTRLAELALTLTLPPLEGLSPAGTNRWRGRLGTSQVEIALRTLAQSKFGFAEPEDVLDSGPSFWSDPAQQRNAPGTRRAFSGPYGYASCAAWERMELRSRDGATLVGLRFLLGGLLPEAGYWITLEASPPPSPENEELLLEFLEQGIVYDGVVRDHRWSEEEARARWLRDAPPATHEDLEILRTPHYLVLTNSGGGKAFARKMEECHDAIREVFPFDDVPGRRLLPVFLFRTSDQYFDFYAAIAEIERKVAERSKGHAWMDYYATWYDAPGDPVHIHEATHQIFSNRLALGGGGSWFQEGVAEYMSSKPGERSAAASAVKRGKHMPLAEFVTIPSLLMSADENAPGGDVAGDHYKQAALLIEFLRESKWARDRFPSFLTRVGRLPRGDRAEIEGAIATLYDTDLAGLEQRWVEYCRKR